MQPVIHVQLQALQQPACTQHGRREGEAHLQSESEHNICEFALLVALESGCLTVSTQRLLLW